MREIRSNPIFMDFSPFNAIDYTKSVPGSDEFIFSSLTDFKITGCDIVDLKGYEVHKSECGSLILLHTFGQGSLLYNGEKYAPVSNNMNYESNAIGIIELGNFFKLTDYHKTMINRYLFGED